MGISLVDTRRTRVYPFISDNHFTNLGGRVAAENSSRKDSLYKGYTIQPLFSAAGTGLTCTELN